MIRGLVEKELRQHAMPLAFLLGALASGLALLNANKTLSQLSGTPLESLHLVLITIAPLACLLLAQLLIAGEFRNKTQLFLEGLPLPRWKMLAVKYVIGLVVVVLGAGFVLGISWHRSIHSDGMTPRFGLILGAKALAWTWFAYSVFFAHGFLGRYRIVTAIVVFGIVIELSKINVPLEKFCAFQLVDSRFGYERILFPIPALAWTAVAIAGLTALGFWMGLMRDATVASLLAERMSSREKTFLTFVSIATLVVIGFIAEHEKDTAPVRLPGSYEVERGPVHVTATAAVDTPLRNETAAVKKVANQVADELQRVCQYLDCKTLPPVFIVHRRDLQGHSCENGNLKRQQGLMVRTNLTAADFEPVTLVSRIIREVLLVKTANRAALEKNAWALDGFPLWWAQMEGNLPAADKDMMNDARAAMPPDFSGLSVRNWMTIQKNAGEKNACALAWSGLALLAERHGKEAPRKFLSEMLGRDASADVRGWLFDAIHPMPSRFKNSTGIPLDAFADEWRAEFPKAAAATANR